MSRLKNKIRKKMVAGKCGKMSSEKTDKRTKPESMSTLKMRLAEKYMHALLSRLIHDGRNDTSRITRESGMSSIKITN